MSKIYKRYPCSILLLIVVLYEIRYDQHSYLWYYRPSIIDAFTLYNRIRIMLMTDEITRPQPLGA